MQHRVLRAALIGVAFVGGSLCCVPQSSDPARQRFLESVLEERAKELDAATRAVVARALIDAQARYGVDAFLLAAVAEHESHFRPLARSQRGARGLMQIRPLTAAAIVERHDLPWTGPDDLFDPSVAVAVGAAYLAELREEFGSWELALIAYHRGPTRVRALQQRGRPLRSRYASRVLELQRLLDEGHRAQPSTVSSAGSRRL